MADHAAVGPTLNATAYDVLKPITTTVLPGLSSLYIALSTFWPLPFVAEIVGTIAAINVFLGGLLTLSNHNYKKSDDRFAGQLIVESNDEEGIQSAVKLGPNFEKLAQGDEVTFKVQSPPSQ